MQLSRFIDTHMDAILADWEVFARRNAPEASRMTDLALRDHSREILRAVALDLASPQSSDEQFTKSQGDSDDDPGPRTAAAIHGALRQGNDFSLLQLSAEFRALRATVLRLWLPRVGAVSATVLEDMVRFNEAIDQALAQSIVAFSERADTARDLFLAVLGHDLRSPIANVSMVGELLARADLPPRHVQELGLRAARSARFMRHMVDDLLSYTRLQMGQGIPTSPALCDLAEVLGAAVADAGATYPKARFEIALDGDMQACVDAVRVQQLLTNLLVNAAQHGDGDRPVRVSATGGDSVLLRVSNHGRPLSAADCDLIFRPLVQLEEVARDDTRASSLGLGLFIAREIALAHGGSIGVTSSAATGTTFEAVLPRGPHCGDVTAATAAHPAKAIEPSMH